MMRDCLEGQGIPLRTVRLFAGESLPVEAAHLRAIVVMGGPMNVDDADRYRFLREEVRFLRASIRAGVPCLGICLGAQLLARALGARVLKAPRPEIGWKDVTLLPEAEHDPVFGRLPAGRIRVWQWHEDIFELPKGAVLLASSEAVPNQAFRYERAIYGIQFHLEMNSDALSSCACPRSMPIDAQAAVAEAKAREGEIHETARAIFGGFLALSHGGTSHNPGSAEFHPVRDQGRQEWMQDRCRRQTRLPRPPH